MGSSLFDRDAADLWWAFSTLKLLPPGTTPVISTERISIAINKKNQHYVFTSQRDAEMGALLNETLAVAWMGWREFTPRAQRTQAELDAELALYMFKSPTIIKPK